MSETEEPLEKENILLFMLYKQRIAQYFRQHRLISSITGHTIVIMFLTIALFSTSLNKSLTSVFAWTSCPAGNQTYSVMNGDTLSNIAASHGTAWQTLAQYNRISNPNWIYPGQIICLPNSHTTLALSNVAMAKSAAPSLKGIIDDVFGADAVAATRIATCESSLNPSAVNGISIGGSHAKGLFQILHPSTWSTTSQAGMSPFDARANTIAAHEIFVRDGHSWREWACRP
jgi:lysozyme